MRVRVQQPGESPKNHSLQCMTFEDSKMVVLLLLRGGTGIHVNLTINVVKELRDYLNQSLLAMGEPCPSSPHPTTTGTPS